MQLSELILKLQEQQKHYGDQDPVVLGIYVQWEYNEYFDLDEVMVYDFLPHVVQVQLIRRV